MSKKKLNELWNGRIPTNNDILGVIAYIRSLRTEAGQKVVETNDDLSEVVSHVGSLGRRAWQKLLMRGPTYENLREVITHIESLLS